MCFFVPGFPTIVSADYSRVINKLNQSGADHSEWQNFSRCLTKNMNTSRKGLRACPLCKMAALDISHLWLWSSRIWPGSLTICLCQHEAFILATWEVQHPLPNPEFTHSEHVKHHKCTDWLVRQKVKWPKRQNVLKFCSCCYFWPIQFVVKIKIVSYIFLAFIDIYYHGRSQSSR